MSLVKIFLWKLCQYFYKVKTLTHLSEAWVTLNCIVCRDGPRSWFYCLFIHLHNSITNIYPVVMFEKAKGKPEPNPKCLRCRMKEESNKEKMKINESQRERVFTAWQSPLRDWLRPVSEWQRPMADWQRPLLSWYVSMSCHVMSVVCQVCQWRHQGHHEPAGPRAWRREWEAEAEVRHTRGPGGDSHDVMSWYCTHFIFQKTNMHTK